MTDPSRVRDLFDLPDQVRKGDFVLKLSEGLARATETVNSYVVTNSIVKRFEQALDLIGAALAEGRSKAGYIHGSFGSGKSHFMALLSLLLDGSEEAWRVPELHGLREAHAWIGPDGAQLAQLHFHMIGADSLESAIFQRYLAFVRDHHADAPIPSLFADEKLFDDAASMLDALGDEAFFAKLNGGAGTSGGGGRLGRFSAGWTRERFDAARASTEPKERAQLFSALAKSYFTSFAEENRSFIDLDRGLAVIAGHAAELGYKGIVLYLDELILWMLGRASESAWLHKEAQKLVKLVEAQEGHREIPIISLIARQRDLADVVGDEYAGAEAQRLRDSLDWSKERFAEVKLEDRDLPAIVEKRILSPKNDAAKKTLDEAFADMRKKAGTSWKTMLGSADADAFRKIYPFSPALLQTLVALSNSLQRERTAIKLLMELLVEHTDDLALGEVVRVGDLFDVLASGDDPADGNMRARFDVSRELYRYRFLPAIQAGNGTTTAERCQRMRPDHPVSIGCSNCPEKICRADNRLVKTLLVAALVPNEEVLKDLTASRLVELNHGSIRVPIAGDEANHVAQKLRTWASSVSQLHVGSERDPSVHLELEDIDVESLLKKASGADQEGARQRVIRDLLFDSMGVDKIADWGKDLTVEWRNTRRPGHLRFGNVRKLGAEQLRCPEGHDWRLVVDYPFDDATFGPNDDLAVVERMTDEGSGTWTLVWLPSFFSEASNKVLGKLTVLEHMLESRESIRRYTADLSAENQVRAEHNLHNLRNNTRTRMLQIIQQAYGLAKERPGDLDPARHVDSNLYVLKAGARVKPGLAGTLADALGNYVEALLEERYPRHPKLTHKLTRQRVDRLVDRFGQICDDDSKRATFEKDAVEEMRGTLGELGLVRTSEGAVHLREDETLQRIENERRKKNVVRPSVGEVKGWNDETGAMGLQADAADLVVRCYARWSSRTLVQFDQPYEATAGRAIPADVELEKPDLPSQSEWKVGLDQAGACFGVTLSGKALHADNLKRLEAQLTASIKEAGGPATAIPGLLKQRLGELGMGEDVDRLTTAVSADQLCAVMAGKSGLEQVRVLAGYAPKTSGRAVGSSLADADAVKRVLEDSLVFGQFLRLQALDGVAGADDLLDKVREAMRQDQVTVKLHERLTTLARQAVSIPPPPVPEPTPVPDGAKTEVITLAATGRTAALKALDDLRAKVDAAGEGVSLTGRVTVTEKP